jgi:hypoxia up-regulated 1
MRNSALLCLCVLLGVLQSARSNVIGIDFASDSIKVAIVQPGTPLEIVSNFQSKRKTPTCVTFYRGERMFGADSYALMSRKPELTFSRIFRMMGRTPSHPLMQEFNAQYFPYSIYANSTSGATSLKMEETQYSPEELMAMILKVRDRHNKYHSARCKCLRNPPSLY